jgi:hypothetical protein
MTEDVQLRNLSAGTQRACLHYITGLARFYQTSPEHLSLQEIREYQLYMISERQYSPVSVNHFVAATWPHGKEGLGGLRQGALGEPQATLSIAAQRFDWIGPSGAARRYVTGNQGRAQQGWGHAD